MSLLVPLIVGAFNVLSPEPQLRETRIVIGVLCLLIVVAGLVLGIVALMGMRRHGRKGILGFAVAGVLLNGVILAGTAFLIPALRRVGSVVNAGYTVGEMETMPRIIPDSRIVLDRAIGFRIEIPNDFQDNPQEQPSSVLYSFLRTDVSGVTMAINIDHLSGRLSREPLGPEAIAAIQKELPSGAEVELIALPWKTHRLDSFVTRFPLDDMMLCNCAAQVPLAREAIQINVAGPAGCRRQCQELLATLLAGLKGLSNWDSLTSLQEHAGIRAKAANQETPH